MSNEQTTAQDAEVFIERQLWELSSSFVIRYLSFRSRRLLWRRVPHQQRNAPDVISSDGHIDPVKPGALEAQLLNVDDEIARDETGVLRHCYFHRNIDAGHDELSVLVHEVEF